MSDDDVFDDRSFEGLGRIVRKQAEMIDWLHRWNISIESRIRKLEHSRPHLVLEDGHRR
jgi:hypothetical protein